MFISMSDQYSLRNIHLKRDYLSHSDLMTYLEAAEGIQYRHANVLLGGGTWQGKEWRPLRNVKPSPNALVIGHSDTVITENTVKEIRSIHPRSIIIASNLSEGAASDPYSYDLPLGIPNVDKSTWIHRVQSSRSVLQLGWALGQSLASRHFRGAYANFSARNNPSERSPVLKIVDSHNHLHQGRFVVSRAGRLQDLLCLSYWGLNICPEGNGPDTHRVYETLLMGAFPIILKSHHVFRLLSSLQLPFVGLANWNQLKDHDLLSENFDALRSRNWDYRPLTRSYWINKIHLLAEDKC